MAIFRSNILNIQVVILFLLLDLCSLLYMTRMFLSL